MEASVQLTETGEDMSESRTSKVGWVTMVLMAVVAWPAVVEAADDADVVVLLTEVVDADVTGDEEIRFWWRGSDQPRWTGTDEAVFEGLRAGGVEPMEPERVDISRIYRRPNLSSDNAAQIGGLLDARRVLVGTVEYRSIEPVAPLEYRGIEARAEVELLPGGDADAVALDQFSITRRLYQGDPEELLDEARQVTGEALGELMGRSLQRARGQIGIETDRELLAFRDVERAEYLEAIRQRLTELEEVERVVDRWATEGLIALEIVPAEGTYQEVLEYTRRVIANHDFEDFRLIPTDDEIAEDTIEFQVETG